MNIRDQIEQQAEATAPIVGGPDPVAMAESGPSIPYLPFPIRALPAELGAIAEEASRAIGCDPAMVALPALAGVGVAIGNTRLLAIKNSWKVPPTIWPILGIPSGNQKSPALDITADYFRAKQDNLTADYKRQQAAENVKPRKERVTVDPKVVWTDDATTEGLSAVMATNQRGILFACDEIGGWLGGMGLYKRNGTVADVSRYCQWYGGRSTNIIRKDKNQPITHAGGVLGITGATTLATLRLLADSKVRESGLLARLLPCCPPSSRRRWTDADVDPETKQGFYDLLDRLFQLQDDNGRPREVSLSPEATIRWQAFFNSHNEELESLTSEDLRAAWSKLEELPCRLALMLHEAEGGGPGVSLDVMERAITLTEWFKHETRRVYGMLFNASQSAESRPGSQNLVEWIRQRGSVTERDLCRSLTTFRGTGGAESARAALRVLVATGQLEAEARPPGEAGGRSVTTYRVAASQEAGGSDLPARAPTQVDPATEPPSPATQPSETREKQGCVAVASVADPETIPAKGNPAGQLRSLVGPGLQSVTDLENLVSANVADVTEEGTWMKVRPDYSRN